MAVLIWFQIRRAFRRGTAQSPELRGWECSRIRRIDGFSRWDGNPRLSFRAIYIGRPLISPSTVGEGRSRNKVTVSYTDVENVVKRFRSHCRKVVSVYDPNGGGVRFLSMR